MQYDFDDTRVKIGRSRNVEKRNKTLEASQDFQILVRRIFLGKGTYERMVHRSLRKFRSMRGPGKEWFLMSSQEAEKRISRTILRRRLWSSGRDPLRSDCVTPRLGSILKAADDILAQNLEFKHNLASLPSCPQRGLCKLNPLWLPSRS